MINGNRVFFWTLEEKPKPVRMHKLRIRRAFVSVVSLVCLKLNGILIL